MSDDFVKSFIDSIAAMATSVRACKGCKQKNRVKPGNANPRCGKCGLPL